MRRYLTSVVRQKGSGVGLGTVGRFAQAADVRNSIADVTRDLEALSEAAAARKRWDFLLTMAPIPVVGGTGSPINPIATF
jgi:hypothetical protein